ASIDNLKNYGLNALHIYAEYAGDDTRAPDVVGSNIPIVDKIVSWTGNAGLYLIITIGGQRCDSEHTHAFWARYAPRYAGNTHVIYEIKNEPSGSFAPPSNRCVRNLNRSVYNAIRLDAPATPILLFSYPFFESGTGIVADIDAMTAERYEGGALIPFPPVDWSKAGVALHGYQNACVNTFGCDNPTATNAAIQYVRTSRPHIAMVNTEFLIWTSPTTFHQPKTQIYEDNHISWMSFLPLDHLNPTTLKNPIDAEEVVWNNQWPGQNWPAVNTPPILSTISLRAKNGKNVTVVPSTRRLFADSFIVGAAEKFVVKRPTGTLPHVCLQSAMNLQYVMANASNKLEASAGFCTNGRFEWMKRPTGAVVLRWIPTHKTVDANVTADASLTAQRIDTPSGEATNFTVTVHP
ncbi:MAG TPA: cellulase family glycosylhydrolase, partial [Thermoanaerobaculia bacterium]|nr:cellulase family glycosylhydrolase [Thermoanaerobaculia bacterium]